jgi:peptidoglycan/xylan/chitin deacetylase (PgdA/CDA1 family)
MIYRIVAIVSVVMVGVALVADRTARVFAGSHAPPRGIWIAAFVVLAAVVLAGMLERRAPVFGAIVYRGRTDVPAIALTFDDGPTEPYTSQILDILNASDIRATFFVIGQKVDRAAAVVKRIVEEGHEIGNHTFDHGVLPLRGPGHIRRTIGATSAVIERVTGVRPTLFRAPHGWRNPWVNRIAREQGCEPVAWTLGVWDTDRPGAAVIRDRTLRGLANGSIVLLHDGRGLDEDADVGQLVEALPGIIDGARRLGFRFTTVGAMLAAGRPQ